MENNYHLVLCIGLTREGSNWDDLFVESLKSTFNAKKVTLIDLPGSGVRLNDNVPISIDGIVDSTRDFYKDELNNNLKRILVTISLGGMIGSSWITRY